MNGRNPDPQGNPSYTCKPMQGPVRDRVQIPPNYDAKRQTGMESAQPAQYPMRKSGR